MVYCPGILTLITPPNAHISIELSAKTGPMPPIMFGFVGIQGPAGVGMHGPGVSTPNAAAVSAAVDGFKRLLQTPNGAMFKNGTQSIQVAIGPVDPKRFFGITVSGVGVNPIGQLSKAPMLQQNPIMPPCSKLDFRFHRRFLYIR